MSATPPGTDPPGIWIRAFWGFTPWDWGHIGWTREADRDKVMSEAALGDLVVIYGADAAETEAHDRRQALGVLQIDPIPIRDADKTSEAALRAKRDRGWADRWTHALPVRRAWRIERRVELRHLAKETYTRDRARTIASRGARLTDAEARAILQLPVTEVAVFGEPPLAEASPSAVALREALAPSRGVEPFFGPRTSFHEDGPHKLYLAQFEGDVAALLGRPTSGLRGAALIKAGFSNEPKRRQGELNAGLPPGGVGRWRMWRLSAPYPNGAAAKEAEDQLKAALAAACESLGGEFFLGREDAIGAVSYSIPSVASFTIRV